MASAVELAGRDILIPAIGRGAGALGSTWQSDVVITNLTDTYFELPVHVEFNDGTGTQTADVKVRYQESVTLADIVHTTFGHDQAFGSLRIRATPSDALLIARAWIYNTSADREGRFGQNVQGLPVEQLARESVLTGIIKDAAHRTNIGISNPNDTAVEVELPSGNITVPARGVVQINDVDAASELHLFTSLPVYAYASIIDAGGDPIFVMASKYAKPAPLAAQCANPAAFTAPPHNGAGPGYIVLLDKGVSVSEFVSQQGIATINLFQFINGFAAFLTPEEVATLRCNSHVLSVAQNAAATRP